MPRKKTYKVIGAAPVLGHQPGETFEAALGRSQEGFLIEIGALKVEVRAEEKK